jgi:hypothetical protein
VKESAGRMKASEVRLMDEPTAAAIGAGLRLARLGENPGPHPRHIAALVRILPVHDGCLEPAGRRGSCCRPAGTPFSA